MTVASPLSVPGAARSGGDDAQLAEFAHLFRRAGFGAGPAEHTAAMAAGYEATVERMVEQATAGEPDPRPAPELVRQDYEVYQRGLRALPAAEREAAQAARRRAEGEEQWRLTTWWLQLMAISSAPLRERMTLIWHSHFATGIQKVRNPFYMYDQNQLLRTHGLGPFPELVQALAKDPAMLIWLDSN